MYSGVEYTVSNWALGNLANFKGLRTNLLQVLITNGMKSMLRRHTTFYLTNNQHQSWSSPVFTMMTCGGGGIAPLILNLRTRWRLMLCFMSWPLYPRKQLYRRMGTNQSQDRHLGTEENLVPLRTIDQWFFCFTARSLITIPTTLSLLCVTCTDEISFFLVP